AGGLTRGLLDAGIEVRIGVDFDDNYRRTYETNNKPAIFHRADIRSLSGLDLERQLNADPLDLFYLAACAPCQPFSRHNKNHYYDRRKSLFLEVGRILTEFEKKPDFIFFENVPAITKVDNGRVIKEFCRVLKRLEYNYKTSIIDAKKYGVPQTRKRFIMIGVKKTLYNSEIVFPEETHGKGRLPYDTVGNAIKHLPRLKAGQRHNSVSNHESAKVKELNLKRLRHTPKNGGSRTAWPEDLILQCHLNHTGHKDVYGRMKWNAPSPTLTCKCVSISNGRFGHPTQLRAISLREAALIQTFPEGYEFFGMFRNMSAQIGNAVPPLLAEIFGKYIVSLVTKKDT
ncbi:MAG: DNA cytosine methyltransferase, partial [Candidatus Omnitrophica bacterium]|nr:DNA cytosine methyltransferase [Candidatus Omnitrophota bacterium]